MAQNLFFYFLQFRPTFVHFVIDGKVFYPHVSTQILYVFHDIKNLSQNGQKRKRLGHFAVFKLKSLSKQIALKI